MVLDMKPTMERGRNCCIYFALMAAVTNTGLTWGRVSEGSLFYLSALFSSLPAACVLLSDWDCPWGFLKIAIGCFDGILSSGIHPRQITPELPFSEFYLFICLFVWSLP